MEYEVLFIEVYIQRVLLFQQENNLSGIILHGLVTTESILLITSYTEVWMLNLYTVMANVITFCTQTVFDKTNLNKNKLILRPQPKYNHFSMPECANTMYQLCNFSLHDLYILLTCCYNLETSSKSKHKIYIRAHLEQNGQSEH